MSKNKLAYNQLSHTNSTTPRSVSSADFYVQVDTREMEKLLSILPEKMTLASRRAAVRTRNWLMTQLRRELASSTAIPHKNFKGRFKRGAYSNEGFATLWIGLNPMDATRAGTPRQNKKAAGPRPIPGAGTKVKKHFFDRAFVADIYNGESVWRRKSFGAGSKAFPVIKMTIPINEEMEEILPKYEEAAARMFSQRLEHEVNYLLGLS
jgi:hypothetical protein